MEQFQGILHASLASENTHTHGHRHKMSQILAQRLPGSSTDCSLGTM